MKRIFILPILILAAFVLLSSIAQTTFAAKVDVCHRPPGNPTNIQIINVSPSAIRAHLTHGDTLVGPEVCNGVDDDCNGVVDDNLTDFGTCTVGVGVCEMTASLECVDGVQVCTAVAGDPLENPESTCDDGQDNDCDDVIDSDDPDCAPSCVPLDGPCLLNNPGVCCSQTCLSISGGNEGTCL